MTSSIVNYIIETYLSNIFEINSEETKTDLWNGNVELNNIKFKNSIFQTLDLPYLELITGYVGKIKANLQLPRFYLYPIKVEIENIFVHSKQTCQKSRLGNTSSDGAKTHRRSPCLFATFSCLKEIQTYLLDSELLLPPLGDIPPNTASWHRS